jgi:predicted Rossmann fold nucleotide-binding protein DprA/Smf involved in DNA uptake
MAAAFEGGGQVVGVLADSLERAIGRPDNRRAMLEGRACLCTPYQPDARFTAGTAMGRNKIIYGLSRVTLVVASSNGDGGTWAGASEAIKRGYGRVAVWMGAGGGPGNEPLAAAGASPVGQPEAVLDLGATPPRSVGSASQMALALDIQPTTGEQWIGAAEPATTSTPSGLGGNQKEQCLQEPALAHHLAPEPEPADDGSPPSRTSPIRLSPGVLAPQPTGVCWCGCGKDVESGAFFLPRHAPGAAQRAVLKHFGNVEQFLVMLGEAPKNGGEPTTRT